MSLPSRRGEGAPGSGGAISAISSMATRDVLVELVSAFEASSGRTVVLESVGGVHAAQRVRAGERFDVIVLARDAIEALSGAGHLRRGTAVDFTCSGVAVAVRAGAERPDIHDEAAVRRAVLAARTVGTSTGGTTALLGLVALCVVVSLRRRKR